MVVIRCNTPSALLHSNGNSWLEDDRGVSERKSEAVAASAQRTATLWNAPNRRFSGQESTKIPAMPLQRRNALLLFPFALCNIPYPLYPGSLLPFVASLWSCFAFIWEIINTPSQPHMYRRAHARTHAVGVWYPVSSGGPFAYRGVADV